MSRQSQCVRIAKFLKHHKRGATVRQLFNLGINCPTKRISELRSAGEDIRDYWDEAENEYGEVTRFKVYYMG